MERFNYLRIIVFKANLKEKRKFYIIFFQRPKHMNIISWNVNGIRAVLKKGFKEFVKKEKPDILLLQETKAHPDQVDEILKEYSFHHWNSAEKKGYSGTAVFSKIEPIEVVDGIGNKEHDQEGRVITLEFLNFFLVNVYVPNSGRGLPRLSYREEWDKDFLKYLKKLEKKKPVVFAGDLNVAHTEIDLRNPKGNYNKTAGYTQKEIDGFENFLKAGFVDTFRMFNDKPGNYTYWSYMFNARKKKVGWRIDYFMISKKIRAKVNKSLILDKVMGSDHCPVKLKLNI